MAELQVLLALMVIALPLLAVMWLSMGFMLGWNRGENGEFETARVSLMANNGSILLLLLLILLSLFAISPGHQPLFQWLGSGEYVIGVSLLLDSTALITALVFSVIFLITLRFSVNYLHRETSFQRFFIVLSLFHFAVLTLVLAGNLWLAFLGWELAGVCSFLLIAFSWQRKTAGRNALRAFITNRVGDVFFLLAMVIALGMVKTLEWPSLFEHPHSNTHFFFVLCLLVPALIKSAQFPFSAWISRALEGPTPSSAVFYGAVLSHLGIFLLIRLSPMLDETPILTWLLVVIMLKLNWN